MQPPAAGAPAPAPAEAPAGGQLPPPNPDTTSPLIKAHEDELAAMVGFMAPELRDAYERVLVAGKKMMYAPETAEAIHGLILDDAVPMKNKLGEGVANLLVMMDNEGNGTIPKDALVPVGVALMFEAADYMFECGIEVTPEDLSDGMEMMIYAIFEAYKVPKAEVDGIIEDLMGKLDLDDEAKEKLTGKVEEREAVDAAQAAAGEDVEATAFQQGFTDEQAKRGV
jgi:hypothetical protein